VLELADWVHAIFFVVVAEAAAASADSHFFALTESGASAAPVRLSEVGYTSGTHLSTNKFFGCNVDRHAYLHKQPKKDFTRPLFGLNQNSHRDARSETRAKG
jgi:hypothetical protein